VILLLVTLASMFLFALGALVGSSLQTQVAVRRSRRLAATQREINDHVRALRAAGIFDARQAMHYMSYEIGS